VAKTKKFRLLVAILICWIVNQGFQNEYIKFCLQVICIRRLIVLALFNQTNDGPFKRALHNVMPGTCRNHTK